MDELDQVQRLRQFLVFIQHKVEDVLHLISKRNLETEQVFDRLKRIIASKVIVTCPLQLLELNDLKNELLEKIKSVSLQFTALRESVVSDKQHLLKISAVIEASEEGDTIYSLLAYSKNSNFFRKKFFTSSLTLQEKRSSTTQTIVLIGKLRQILGIYKARLIVLRAPGSTPKGDLIYDFEVAMLKKIDDVEKLKDFIPTRFPLDSCDSKHSLYKTSCSDKVKSWLNATLSETIKSLTERMEKLLQPKTHELSQDLHELQKMHIAELKELLSEYISLLEVEFEKIICCGDRRQKDLQNTLALLEKRSLKPHSTNDRSSAGVVEVMQETNDRLDHLNELMTKITSSLRKVSDAFGRSFVDEVSDDIDKKIKIFENHFTRLLEENMTLFESRALTNIRKDFITLEQSLHTDNAQHASTLRNELQQSHVLFTGLETMTGKIIQDLSNLCGKIEKLLAQKRISKVPDLAGATLTASVVRSACSKEGECQTDEVSSSTSPTKPFISAISLPDAYATVVQDQKLKGESCECQERRVLTNDKHLRNVHREEKNDLSETQARVDLPSEIAQKGTNMDGLNVVERNLKDFEMLQRKRLSEIYQEDEQFTFDSKNKRQKKN